MKTTLAKFLAAQFLALTFFLPFSASAANGPEDNIIDIAVKLNAPGGGAEGAFDTLIAALLVADPAVIQKLGGFGRFTVFAPTDDAFAAIDIDETNVGDLDQTVLTQILLYHVAQGRRTSESVLASERIFMTFGGFLQQSGGVLTDNLDRPATIIVLDQLASNGVVHAIDAVVLPFAP